MPTSTIRELAKHVGVSVATVSRVLNDYPDVADETRERVRAAIRELDFRPNRVARSLVTGRTHVIGVVFETGVGHPDLLHPFFQEVLEGFKGAAGALGYDLLLFGAASNEGDSVSGSYLSRVRQHRVDGVVVMGVDRGDPQVQELARSGIPCMGVDLDLEGGRAGHVSSDNATGAALAVRHLFDLGHRRIALIGGPISRRPGIDRRDGYRREVRRLGLDLSQEYEIEGDFYPESGHRAATRLLELADPPTALFAAADMMAAGAIQAAAARGISVPNDLAVVGFDDIALAPLLQPPLTTIHQDKGGLGGRAADALARMIAEPQLAPPVISVPVQLVVRASTAAPGRGGKTKKGGDPLGQKDAGADRALRSRPPQRGRKARDGQHA